MPLNFMKPMQNCRIIRIRGKDGIISRLKSLRLTENTTIRILQSAGSNLIIEVRNSRLALDSVLVGKIEVVPE